MEECQLVNLANSLSKAGVKSKDLSRYFSHSRHDPEELKPAGDFEDEILNAFYPPGGKEPGVSSPWEKTKKIIRFRPNDLSIWTGINGHGKSQFLGHIALDAISRGYKVCIASLELKPCNLLKRLTRQAAALEAPSEAYIKAISEWYYEKLWIFDLVGNTSPDRLLEVFSYAQEQYNIDMFIIDSLMRCGIAEDDYNSQKDFVSQLCDFKNQYNTHIHLITHPRKSIDETKIPGKMDISGTGAISNQADNCFTVWRNKKKENEIQDLRYRGIEPAEELLRRPDCIWLCDKQRNGSNWEGKILLWFDQQSFQYLNHPKQKPMQYVEFSTAKNIA